MPLTDNPDWHVDMLVLLILIIRFMAVVCLAGRRPKSGFQGQ